jgi:CDP-diacylglycerol--glycerol-3-phosphate 3-phosphatidyltransferase
MEQFNVTANLFLSIMPVVVFCSIVVASFLVFCTRVVLYGMPKSPRVQQESNSIFLSKLFMEFWTWFIKPIVQFLIKLRITPDAITIMGAIVAAGAGLAFHFGSFLVGGWMILAAGTFDMLDGNVARATNAVSKSGAFLDSTLDRYAELFMFAGLISYYKDTSFLVVVLLAVIGSMMVSYARARAEGVGVEARMGNMQRTERIVYLGLGTAFAPVVASLVEPNAVKPYYHLGMLVITVVAIFANATAIRRMIHTYYSLKVSNGKSQAKVIPLPEVQPPKLTRVSVRAVGNDSYQCSADRAG